MWWLEEVIVMIEGGLMVLFSVLGSVRKYLVEVLNYEEVKV